MRKNFGAKPLSYPQPVFIVGSYDENGVPDAMNAAWAGISGRAEVSLCLTARHKTVQNILKTKAFTLSIGDAAHVIECDYVGIVSANDVPDKFAKAGLHAIESEFVNAPLVAELPVALECKLKRYDAETGHMIGEIVNVCAEEAVLDEEGNVDVAKVHPIVYDPFRHDYLMVGEKVGKAYEDGKKII